jgi:hypothetical protein
MRASLLLLLPLLFGACQSTVDPSATALQLRTEGSKFVLSASTGSVSVPFTIKNRGSASVFVARCGGRVRAALDRREDGRWVQYSGDACLAIYPMDPVEVGAHQVLRGARAIRERGQYRLRIGVTEEGESVWKRTSNSFTVR